MVELQVRQYGQGNPAFQIYLAAGTLVNGDHICHSLLPAVLVLFDDRQRWRPHPVGTYPISITGAYQLCQLRRSLS